MFCTEYKHKIALTLGLSYIKLQKVVVSFAYNLPNNHASNSRLYSNISSFQIVNKIGQHVNNNFNNRVTHQVCMLQKGWIYHILVHKGYNCEYRFHINEVIYLRQ